MAQSSMSDTLAWAIRRTGLKVPTPVFRPIGAGATAEQAALVQMAVKESGSATALATTILAALAVLYTLFFASALILPVVASVLLSFLLRGPVRRLRRHGIREPIGAGIVVFGMVVAAVVSLSLLSGPARTWVERAPKALGDVEFKLRALTAPLLKWEATAARVSQLGSPAAPSVGRAPVTVLSGQTGLLRRAFGSVASALTATLSVIFLTYFLLASGDLFMRKLQKVLPGSDEAPGPRKLSEDVEEAVSTYLRTSVLINIGLGLATWGLLHLLKMPNAGLFGALAGLLNFVPYLGALLTTAILSVAALAVFDTPGRALMVPGAYLVLNLIESNGVTPLLMGRQFPLNAVALFGGVLFWGALWGIPGAILAVPITVTIKLVADTVPSLSLLAEFLGE
jgi:predicted PurR-regulated permease PerM